MKTEGKAKAIYDLTIAGLSTGNGETLMSLEPNERHKYEKSDPSARWFQELINLGLALNISSEFSGDSLGIRLSFAGEVIHRLALMSK